MRLYSLACGFLFLCTYIMGCAFHDDLLNFQLWMPITIAFSILATMVTVGAELFVTMGTPALVPVKVAV
jgi:hypothetical protein